MRVLIVQPNPSIAEIWRRHLERRGAEVEVATTQDEAVAALQGQHEIQVIVLDLVLADGSAFAVADYASYRRPEAKVVFVTNTTFFSDGSIFRHIPNASAFVRVETPVEDLAAIVEHYAEAR